MKMAQAYKWRSEPNIIARMVDGNEIKTWRSRHITLKPNEACVFIVDGQIGSIFSDQMINQIGGGFARHVASVLGATATDRRILFGMTGPFEIAIPFSTLTQKGLQVQGHVRLRLKLMKEDLPKMLNYFANHGSTLTRINIVRLLQEHVNQRLIASVFANCDRESYIRSEPFQAMFSMNAEALLRHPLSSIGLTLLSAYAVPERTSSEHLALHKVKVEQGTEHEQINATARQKAIELREATALRTIACEVEVARAKIRGDQTLEVEKELKHIRALEAVLRSEDERNTRLIAEHERQKATRMEQAMAMFERVQSAKLKRQNTI